jgi:hypothetical protein
MKKYLPFLAILSIYVSGAHRSFAQGGIVYTTAGCAAPCITTTVEAAPSNMAELTNTSGIAVDATNNVYIADEGFNRVRRVDASTRSIYTVAGTSIAGFSGDGGAATVAQLNGPLGICLDAVGNVYIADGHNNRIRKVDVGTRVITTIAGGGASLADGVPATTASITPKCVYVDVSGNVYIGSGNKIRKINGATGILTTIAGNGVAVDTGDGGAATAAGILGSARCITADVAGNMYIISAAGDRVRKINATTGIITTVAGGGSCTIDGAPATNAQLSNIHSCVVDHVGNVIVADRGKNTIRWVDAATGYIYTIAGGGSYSTDGISAMIAAIRAYMLCIDRTSNNIYYTDSSNRARRITYSPLGFTSLLHGSHTTQVIKQCNGPQITINASTYSAGSFVKTLFGDGQSSTDAFASGCTGGGLVTINHNYVNSGTYTIKHMIYTGGVPVDSIHYPYQHTLCKMIYLKFFSDLNSNCIFDSGEYLADFPMTLGIDSNGVRIDTIPVRGGLYYPATGNPGDIYTFRLLSMPPGVAVVCPASGIFSDTLQPSAYNYVTKYFPLLCTAGTGYDLQIFTSFRTGPHSFAGTILVDNNYCAISPAMITMQLGPKYGYCYSNVPPTTGLGSYGAHNATWNLTGLTSANALPMSISIDCESFTGHHSFGDTTNSLFTITPIVGDAFPLDNTCRRVDTVKSGFDPNFIDVVPSGCIHPQTTLRYTVNFENTGNDTAFNIHVMDTLSDNLNPSTLRVLMSSAVMDIAMFQGGGHNVVKFDFPNINLLDSSHHGQCDGTVIYTIDTKPGMPMGTNIFGRAGIYFDDNDVVMTNTVQDFTSPICAPDGIKQTLKTDASIYPNPATSELFVKMGNIQYESVMLTNMIGQEVIKQPFTGTLAKIDIRSLPAGVYYITLKGTDNIRTEKFVKY